MSKKRVFGKCNFPTLIKGKDKSESEKMLGCLVNVDERFEILVFLQDLMKMLKGLLRWY